eukprot:gene801-2541_t
MDADRICVTSTLSRANTLPCPPRGSALPNGATHASNTPANSSSSPRWPLPKRTGSLDYQGLRRIHLANTPPGTPVLNPRTQPAAPAADARLANLTPLLLSPSLLEAPPVAFAPSPNQSPLSADSESPGPSTPSDADGSTHDTPMAWYEFEAVLQRYVEAHPAEAQDAWQTGYLLWEFCK